MGNVFSQESKNFMYGKVTTIAGKVYTGYINWGDGSFLWTNIFNADKNSNPYYGYIPENKKTYRKRIVDEDGRVRIINRNYYLPINHVFDTRFGNIRSIELSEDGSVYVELKEEKFIQVKNYKRDVGKTISINDINLGQVKIEWRRVWKVDFMAVPNDIDFIPGKPIYGTVNCTHGIFTGFIFWDRDENILSDKLDGEYEGSEISVKFEKIKSISKASRGCDVKLNNGQQIYLRGSNDVNDRNRGIIVYMPHSGRVEIDWHEFISVVFDKVTDEVGISYSGFKSTERLTGTVYVNDSTYHKGVIVFDLDEAMNSEILDGSNEGLKYRIPFKYIKTMESVNRIFSKVELKNGAKLLLGSSSDVNYRNDGVLIFKSSTDYEFLYWDEVGRIVFE